MENISHLIEKIRRARLVFVIGNGGSYANAAHLANDLWSVGISAFVLDPAYLTATANDYGYDEIFSRWLATAATRDDLLIALSGSGTSRNIVRAIEEAKRIGMAYQLCTDYLRQMDMQQSEEMQIVLGHELMRGLRGQAT